MGLKDTAGLTVLICLVGACSTDDPAERYFVDLAVISSTLDTELGDIEGTFNAGLLDIDFETAGAEAQLIDVFRTSMFAIGDSFEQLMAGLQGLSPPHDLEDPHGRMVAAASQGLADYESRAGQLEAITNLEDIDRYAGQLTATVARNRFAEACRDVQQIAIREAIDVDLNC